MLTSALTPEEIKCVREWAASGNEDRCAAEVPAEVIKSKAATAFCSPHVTSFNYRLTDAGLTIAALADAFEQACETAEEYSEETGWHESVGGSDLMRAMRANRERLLG